MANRNNEKIELLKDVYNHIIYQFNFADGANEGLSNKAMQMAGFCGVIIGLLVNMIANIEQPLGNYVKFMFISTVILIFISILCYITAALVRRTKSLIQPEFLLDKLKENVSREKFWKEFVKVAKKAYEDAKKVNFEKSANVRLGDIFFILGGIYLVFLFVVIILR